MVKVKETNKRSIDTINSLPTTKINTLSVIQIADVVIGGNVRVGNEQQQKKLIDCVIPDINVLNAVFNLEGIRTFAMILVTMLLEIAMIYITKSTMGK